MTQETMVSLANLGRGAAIERFDDEFARVLQNILDPNTIPTAKREVTLTVQIKPSEKRDFAMVHIHCKSKLAGAQPLQTQIFVGWDGKMQTYVASEPNQDQLGLPVMAQKKAEVKND